MECIEFLKKLDIKEVSLKTRITQDKLKSIIECEFDNFDKIKAKGFSQIIQREFKIDMQEWLKAYEEHHRKQEAIEAINNIGNKEIEDDVYDNITSEKIYIAVEGKKDRSYLKLFAFLAILVLAFVVYFIYNNVFSTKDLSTTNTSNTNNMQDFKENNAVTEENTQDLQSLEISQESIQNNATIPNQTDDILESDALKQEQNINQNLNEVEFNIVESNADQSSASKPNTTESSTTQSNSIESKESNSQELVLNISEITFIPKEPLWIGVIDLQTYKKKQLSTSSRYNIKLDNNKLIRTGHSHFSLTSPNGFSKNYIGGDNKYFLYTNEDGFKEIDKAKFLSLNKGEEW